MVFVCLLAFSDFIWCEDLNRIPGLADALAADLEIIRKDGMRAAVEAIL